MILAGSKYYAAIPILQTVILFSFLRPFSYQFGTTMDAIGKPKINFWVNLLTMSLNYAFMYLGLRYTGWLGAAYGTVVSAIFSFLIMYSVLNKTIGVRLSETFRYVWVSYREIYDNHSKNYRKKRQCECESMKIISHTPILPYSHTSILVQKPRFNRILHFLQQPDRLGREFFVHVQHHIPDIIICFQVLGQDIDMMV